MPRMIGPHRKRGRKKGKKYPGVVKRSGRTTKVRRTVKSYTRGQWVATKPAKSRGLNRKAKKLGRPKKKRRTHPKKKIFR